MARIAFFGAGYAGLVSGACFADLGHTVVIRDVVSERIEGLRAGRVPFFEPGLAELIARNADRLSFTLSMEEAVEGSDFLFVCVGTPPTASGDANLSAVWSVIEDLPQDLGPVVLVMKSTVPVGTGEKVRAELDRRGLTQVGYASCPEFLAEGTAVHDFLAGVCVAWEHQAQRAEELGMRVVRVRTGVVLDGSGGALARMLTPFKLGIGGPVAGGNQYMPWIHADDLVGIYLAAIDDASWTGPVNASAPEPVTNAVFSKALGRALHRPAVLPIPGFALHLLYGEMAEVVTEGQRAVPRRPLDLGYAFEHPDLDEALRDALRD